MKKGACFLKELNHDLLRKLSLTRIPTIVKAELYVGQIDGRRTVWFLAEKRFLVIAPSIIPSAFNAIVIELHAVLVFASTRCARIPEIISHQRPSDPSPNALHSTIASANPDPAVAFLRITSIPLRQEGLSCVVQNDRQLGIIRLTNQSGRVPIELLFVQRVLERTRWGGGRWQWVVGWRAA